MSFGWLVDSDDGVEANASAEGVELGPVAADGYGSPSIPKPFRT